MKTNIIKTAGLVLSVLILISGALVLTGCEDTLTAAIEEEIEIALAAGNSPYDGTLIINSGVSYTNNITLNLAIFAKDDIEVTYMRISENSDYSDNSWVPYETTYSFDLAIGDGTKTVYIWFKDDAEQISSRYSDSIILDTSSPSINTVTPSDGAPDIEREINITVQFNQSVNQSTITDSSFYILRNGIGAHIAGTISYNSGSNTATLNPSVFLDWDTSYTAYITTGVADSAGNTLTSSSTWNFTIKAKQALLNLRDSLSVSSIVAGSATGSEFHYMDLDSTGNYLYVTADSNESWGVMGKISVIDPLEIAVVTDNDLSTDPRMVAIIGSDIFVTHDNSRVYKMDTSLNENAYGPSDSVYYGKFLNVGGSGANILVQVAGSNLNGLYTSLSAGNEMSSSDFSDTKAMITVGNYTYLGQTDAQMSNTNVVEIIDTETIGGGGVSSIKRFDITTQTTGSDQITGLASDGGELLYVTHADNNTTGIVVIDTNDPSDPFSIVIANTPTSNLSSIKQSEGISIADDINNDTYAIVALGSLGLAVLDLTSAYNPEILISSKILPASAYRVLFDGQYVYVFTGSSRNFMTSLYVYELSIF